jgi:hypothetical protein
MQYRPLGRTGVQVCLGTMMFGACSIRIITPRSTPASTSSTRPMSIRPASRRIIDRSAASATWSPGRRRRGGFERFANDLVLEHDPIDEPTQADAQEHAGRLGRGLGHFALYPTTEDGRPLP